MQQLGAHLATAFPGALGLFSRLDSPVAAAFLTRFPSPTEAAWLSPRRFEAWLAKRGYAGWRRGAELHARMVAAPAGVSVPEAEPLAAITLGYVQAIAALCEQIMLLEARIAEQLSGHPDGAIFTSLPRSGSVRAATLLAEIGDCRERFPAPEALACLAGAAPSTRRSGQHHAVTFRYACDKKLRDALIDFAGGRRFDNVWAADLYERAIARGKRHPHAVRILARALGPCHLALLAGRRSLPPRAPSGAPAGHSREGGLVPRLDIGLLRAPLLRPGAARSGAMGPASPAPSQCQRC